MKSIHEMTKEELIEMAQKFSGFNGGDPNPSFQGESQYSDYNSPEYSGYGDAHVDFIGKQEHGSFFNLNDSEPFQLQITNANAGTRTFWLSNGLSYVAGAELPGQIPVAAGAFRAEEDAFGVTSLTAATPNLNQTWLKFLNFTRKNPTFSHIIQATSDQPIAQLRNLVYDGKTGIIRDETFRTIPWRKYGNGDQYHLEFIDLKEPVFIDDQNVVKIQVAGMSTLSLNIYLSASDNGAAKLRKRVNKAKHTAQKQVSKGKTPRHFGRFEGYDGQVQLGA